MGQVSKSLKLGEMSLTKLHVSWCIFPGNPWPGQAKKRNKGEKQAACTKIVIRMHWDVRNVVQQIHFQSVTINSQENLKDGTHAC